MTTYESEIKTISSSEEVVFAVLSDLNNLSKVADNKAISDKIKDLQYDTDSCSFAIEGFGRVGFKIIEREPFKTIKLDAENTPVPINVWIQLKQVADNDTRMKLTLKAELPAMIKMMLDKKLKDGINAIADFLVIALNK
jgi:hypothetical protein